MAPGAGLEPARLLVNSQMPFQLGYPGMNWSRSGESNTGSLVPKTSAFPLGYSAIGRGGWIRTSVILLPTQARKTAPIRPEKSDSVVKELEPVSGLEPQISAFGG